MFDQVFCHLKSKYETSRLLNAQFLFWNYANKLILLVVRKLIDPPEDCTL